MLTLSLVACVDRTFCEPDKANVRGGDAEEEPPCQKVDSVLT